MTIDAITRASDINPQTIATATTARTPKQTLDSEAFMSLLVAQLTNQDPSSPMDTNQMIGQTTQLAMMEKLTELATTGQEDFSLQMRIAAASILGQEVSYTGADGKTVTGVATAVSYAGGVPTITVGDKDVPLDVISGLSSKPAN